MITQARTFFCKGDFKSMVIQFIAGNYRIELYSYPLHFTFKARPTEGDGEAMFLKSTCSSDNSFLSDDGFNNLSVIGKGNDSPSFHKLRPQIRMQEKQHTS